MVSESESGWDTAPDEEDVENAAGEMLQRPRSNARLNAPKTSFAARKASVMSNATTMTARSDSDGDSSSSGEDALDFPAGSSNGGEKGGKPFRNARKEPKRPH